DPCRQAAVARTLALFHSGAKNYENARKWLAQARERCCSVTDLYAGLLVEILVDQVRLAKLRGEDQEAAMLARDLLPVVARTHADGHLDYATSILHASANTGRRSKSLAC
ncbi:MAG: hypothetical protein ACR2PG_10900, partial [Hyphomicrobiaceae bacterium]